MEIVALCRTGFEKEVAAELADFAGLCGVSGYPKTREGQGYVQFVCAESSGALDLICAKPFEELVFVRDWFIAAGEVADLDPNDRVSALVEAYKSELAGYVPDIAEWVFLNVDSNEGKSLSKLTRGVGNHCQKELGLKADSQWVATLLLTSGTSGFLGVCPKNHRPRWPGGIAHLKLPKAAPSRATLKLEEAWHHFIPSKEWDRRLARGMHAVDLGAAPGGWTYQLVARSMFVDAVDNGPMALSLMETGQVRHHHSDGFQYQPPKPVDWLVCDIADKPSRVASMMALWGEHAWFGEAVFNLKLPMKKRYMAVQQCRAQIQDRLWSAGRAHQLLFKQLYHDREEVTGWLRITG